MPETGISPAEVGREIGHHADQRRERDRSEERRDRQLLIVEAILLSVVALLAGWSGYAAAKWNTDSSLILARESTLRIEASRANLQALDIRNFDASTFNTWFSAFVADDREAMRIAERRFRPQFRVAFRAWRAARPETNPDAPPGPTFMPQYRQPGLAQARALDAQADHALEEGTSAARHSDAYVRTTVFLAIVLFLVGISTHFPYRGGRYLLVGSGTVLLLFSIVLIVGLPAPAD